MTTILLVEDDPDLRQELQEVLEQAGYGVLPASGGDMALKTINGKSIDAVLTDIVMAGGEGIELIMSLRKQLPDIPICAMSAKRDYLKCAEKLGASHSLLKPFPIRDLFAFLDPPA